MSRIGLLLVITGCVGSAVHAQGAPSVNPANTAWVLIAAALVMLMTPGLALFYGGLVRRKNVLSTLMHSMFALGLVTLHWVVLGYTLAFGPDVGHVIGGLHWLFLRGVGAAPNPDYVADVPHLAFMVFQMMFAILTPALISGAFAERMKFSAFTLFILLWSTLVYAPLAHWVWGVGGWLREWGVLDFAGGTVVHISSGCSALAAALLVGRRLGYPHEPLLPNNLTMSVLGAGLLWFGWFGFNAGSALSAGELAATAFVTTHIAASAAAVSWGIAEAARTGKVTMLGVISGAIAGLVAITPAAGFVAPWAAIVIGLLAGWLCYGAVALKPRLGYDDALDAFGIHGVGGFLGALLTGVFATVQVNPAGADGLIYGNAMLLLKQLVAAGVSALYAFLITAVILLLLQKVVGLRVSEEEELVGLDLTQHGEAGYHLS